MLVRRFAVLAMSAALLGLALVPALASAGGSSPTKITLSIKLPAFHGKLTSPREACLGSRTVKMYRKHKGKTVQLGKAKSKDNGAWKVPVGKNFAPGEYFATVSARGKCKPAKSNVFRIA